MAEQLYFMLMRDEDNAFSDNTIGIRRADGISVAWMPLEKIPIDEDTVSKMTAWIQKLVDVR